MAVVSAETTEEFEQRLGGRIRSLRLSRNLDQSTVASKAGVSLRTIKNLEAGRGSSVATLVRVVRALGRGDWFDALEPAVSVSPLRMLAQERRDASPQRASRSRATRPVEGAPEADRSGAISGAASTGDGEAR
ncbi:helix-turn-helix domain-containing protein [Herbiconiux daphne]|uniref:Helix-turn-helix transcriptional regulator n=1 Tax=Herbiconiux daphne TaxID=2970914 RepID=A0ABT2H2K2_9MICO|nr:helix-turn-helix transcriptional regulator [Herbiconiux daphne]MCS5734178.1 helix-turn-helix transcriptional regulator [Herbiconiux daphne]